MGDAVTWLSIGATVGAIGCLVAILLVVGIAIRLKQTGGHLW